jgi:hypothetical protein
VGWHSAGKGRHGQTKDRGLQKRRQSRSDQRWLAG